MVGSVDAQGLYQSLNVPKCCKMTSERVMKTGLKFWNVDLKWALNMDQEDIYRERLADIIPFRRSTKDHNRPTVLTVDKDSKRERWKWSKPTKLYTPDDINRVLKKVIEIAALLTFHNHFYKCGGALYRQKYGGAIGLKATWSLARLLMEHWMEEYIQKLENLGVPIHFIFKYVDVLIITRKCERGTRFKDGKLIQNKEDIETDKERSEEVTMQLVAGRYSIKCL